jgi:hypothetical protein
MAHDLMLRLTGSKVRDVSSPALQCPSVLRHTVSAHPGDKRLGGHSLGYRSGMILISQWQTRPDMPLMFSWAIHRCRIIADSAYPVNNAIDFT